MAATPRANVTAVVVATTVMLSFISFWRAAAIVLSDLASSAYYVGGIAETAIGKAAPWFILAIMLFSYAVRAVYIESCSMFVRGGVYRVVHEAMGGTLAKISVSALMFDYVLTGPISGVSAGLYLGGLINETAEQSGLVGVHVYPPYFAAAFAIVVTLYFWWQNTVGIRESSEKALRIMQVTTVMVVTLIAWCLVTILTNGAQAVPAPVPANLHFAPEALGWLTGTIAPSLTVIAILIGLGHSLLAMSGEETLAQVNREIEAPKLKNLERAGFVIFLYSLLFTSLVSFFAVMLIPDGARTQKYADNLIGGLAMFLVGPVALRLVFHGFVVVVGTLILAGAVNTAIIGSNGVLNRVAEDGVLTDWFRQPHPKNGTTYRLINLVVGLQIFTILISRGNLYMLGEAYAFGVVWSFAMKALAVLVLRYKEPEGRAWKVPLNVRVGRTELPLGLALITVTLFALATINLVTKRVATISGVSFTIAFFTLFVLSERYNRRRHTAGQEMEKFRLDRREEVSLQTVQVHPGSILVAIRYVDTLDHLKRVLDEVDTAKIDVVVMSVRAVTAAASGEHGLAEDQLFAAPETELFSRAVTVAEKAGKHVALVVVPATDGVRAIVETAHELQSSRIVIGASPRMSASRQADAFREAWQNLPEPRRALAFEIILNERNEPLFYHFGQPPPRPWPRDVEVLDRLWRELHEHGHGVDARPQDIIGVALRRLDQQLRGAHGDKILRDVLVEVSRAQTAGRGSPVDLDASGEVPPSPSPTREEDTPPRALSGPAVP